MTVGIRTRRNAWISGALRIVFLARSYLASSSAPQIIHKFTAFRSQNFRRANFCRRQEADAVNIRILASQMTNRGQQFAAENRVRISTVTLAVRETNLIASRILIFASFGVIHLARLYLASLNFTKIHQKLNCREVRAILTKQIFSRTRLFSKVI